nr:cyclin-dependent kinase F-4-like [Tanacetum cinerariifolium]
MEKYLPFENLGHGSFGVVFKAFNKHTHEVVAIKKLMTKYYSSEDCKNQSEVKSLIKMNNHPNIIRLQEIIKEKNKLFFVFEYMECNLYQRMIQHETPFSETEIRNMCFQVFHGLAYMHQRGYFHRDLKPENLLMNKDIVKIADLRMLNDHSPITFQHFAIVPLRFFYIRQYVMYKICSVLGTPTDSMWPGGLDLAKNICYQFPNLPGVWFSDLLPNASPELVNLIATLLSWEPSYRPTAIEALQHPFFHSCYFIPPTVRLQDTSFTLLDS